MWWRSPGSSPLRAAVPAQVELLIGAWCYFTVAVLVLVADRALDKRGAWNAILPDASSPPGTTVASCGVCEMVVPAQDRRRPRVIPLLILFAMIWLLLRVHSSGHRAFRRSRRSA